MLAISQQLVKIVRKICVQFDRNYRKENEPLPGGRINFGAASSNSVPSQWRIRNREKFLDLPTFMRRGISAKKLQWSFYRDEFQGSMESGNGAAGTEQ